MSLNNPQILSGNDIAKTEIGKEAPPKPATETKMAVASVLSEKDGVKTVNSFVSDNSSPAAVSDKKSPEATTPTKSGFFSMFQRKKNIPEAPLSPSFPTNTPPNKKSLPPDVQKHFEANSSAFVAFAQKKDTGISKKIEEPKEMDVWDKAILLGEFPGGNVPVEIRAPSDKKEPVVPRKPLLPILGRTLPNQFFPEKQKEPIKAAGEKEKDAKPVAPINIGSELFTLPRFIPRKPAEKHAVMTSEIKQPVVPDKKTVTVTETEKDTKPVAPINISPEIFTLPRFIPRKPAGVPVATAGEIKPMTAPDQKSADEIKNLSFPDAKKISEAPVKNAIDISFGGLMTSLSSQIGSMTVPKKPTENNQLVKSQININTMQTPTNNQTNGTVSTAPESEMGEQLQKKIIEGQLKSIFEDAPAGVREELEKTLASDILSIKNIEGDVQNQNDVWKKRLLDYIIKLKWQGKTAFKKTEDTDPKEGETIASFIQRIYPSVIKVEMKEE
jgi:hypothetical protein